MEPAGSEKFVSPTEETVPLEDGRAPAPPRFDEKSIQRAQPAVPLTLGARARSWPTVLIVLCVVGGVVGGVLGGLALTLFQRDGSRAEPPAMAARPETGVVAPQPASQGGEPSTPAEAAPAAPAAGTQPAEAAAAQTGAVVAQPAAAQEQATAAQKQEPAAAPEASAAADAGTEGELRAALGEWLAATNSRDVGRQMSYYAPRVEAFYLSRNAPREAVRAEKARLFAQAASVNVEAAPPEIRMSRDGRTAVMRFRKRYQITGGEGARSGEVLQELRWRRTEGGWKIVGERDLRVLR
jgi:ketosteroid isomerase-like protein